MRRYDSLSALGQSRARQHSLTKQAQSLNAADHWEEASSCWECSAPFTLTCRRHHCRLCLRSFCADHASCFVQLVGRENDEPQRVCAACRSSRAFLSPRYTYKRNQESEVDADIDDGAGAALDADIDAPRVRFAITPPPSPVGNNRAVPAAGAAAGAPVLRIADETRVRVANAPRPPFASPPFKATRRRQLLPAPTTPTQRGADSEAAAQARATLPPTPMPSPRLPALGAAHLASIGTAEREPLSPASKDRALVRRRSQRTRLAYEAMEGKRGASLTKNTSWPWSTLELLPIDLGRLQRGGSRSSS